MGLTFSKHSHSTCPDLLFLYSVSQHPHYPDSLSPFLPLSPLCKWQHLCHQPGTQTPAVKRFRLSRITPLRPPSHLFKGPPPLSGSRRHRKKPDLACATPTLIFMSTGLDGSKIMFSLLEHKLQQNSCL